MTNTSFTTWPSFSEEEARVIYDILLSNKVNYWTGSEGRNFENEFANWCDVKYAIALANGTVALDIAFKVLEISSGDELIVTSRTYIATVSSIVNAGAIPIFADVDLDSQNISPLSIREKITNNTKAIVCVHLAGWPCEMDAIINIAEEFGLYVIEDCAQAHGAKYKEKKVGSIGHIACWSFCQDKIISTGGEGGMVTTNDEILWRKMWSYKDHGKRYETKYDLIQHKGFSWTRDSFGTNFRMTEMQAAIGRIQLKRMNFWHNKRLSNANKIWNIAKEFKGLSVPNIPDYIEHAAYKCYLFVRPFQLKKDWNRDRIIDEINSLGVPCSSGSCPEVYLERAFDATDFRPIRRLKNSKELGETSLMFLVHPTLKDDEIQKTCDTIRSVMKLASKPC